jgi:hypothetical protein
VSGKTLEEMLIDDVVDNNPSILHKLMQVSTFSYIEKRRPLDYADGEFPLYAYRKNKNGTIKKDDSGNFQAERWNADLLLLYNDDGKRVCEIVEIETVAADELLHHRKKNIVKKIATVERAYDTMKLNRIFQNADEIRFSLSLNAVHLTEKERYEVAKQISKSVIWDMNHSYKDNKVSLYKIYMLKDSVWDYCSENEEKQFLMKYNYTMQKNLWKKPIRKTMLDLYYNLKDQQKVKQLYERYYFKK